MLLCGCGRLSDSADALGGAVAGCRLDGLTAVGAEPRPPSFELQKLVVQRQAKMLELEPLSEMSRMSQLSVFFRGFLMSPRSTLVGKHSRSSAGGGGKSLSGISDGISTLAFT